MKFIHTADWQIGKPFQSIADPAKREKLRAKRLETIEALKHPIEAQDARFVVVSGDLFDSFTPDKSTVAALCATVGKLEVPVYAIPGNHDHAGPGCIWRQAFFLHEQKTLAPNFHVFLEASPFITPRAVLLPCPLKQRQVNEDSTAWLRETPSGLPQGLPRIVIAHGSTQGFSSTGDEDGNAGTNQLQLDRLPADAYDYIALGDWHGAKQITANAWYSGTPEQDRFAKGENNQPGHVLMVEIDGHGSLPSVKQIATGRVGWHAIEFPLPSDNALDELENALAERLGQRAGEDLLKLELEGTLALSGSARLEKIIERLEARLIHLRTRQHLRIEPSETEIESLTNRDDPLIGQVAIQLTTEASSTEPEAAELAIAALRELFLQVRSMER